MLTCCAGTAFYNRLLKKREKEEVTGRKGRKPKQLLNDLKEKEDTENLKREHYVALSGEFVLEEATDLL